MGEAGAEAEDVDERMWNDEDDETPQGQVRGAARRWACLNFVHWRRLACEGFHAAGAQPGLLALPASSPCCLQEQEGPDDRSVQVGDKSQLDYAAGGEEEEDQEQPKDGGKDQQQQQQQKEQEQPQGGEDKQQQPGAEEEEENEEEQLGDYQDR